jgi:hypothetical protein
MIKTRVSSSYVLRQSNQWQRNRSGSTPKVTICWFEQSKPEHGSSDGGGQAWPRRATRAIFSHPSLGSAIKVGVMNATARVFQKARALWLEKKSSTARKLAVPLILAGVPGPEIALRVGVSNSAIKKCARFFSGAMCAGQTGCGKYVIKSYFSF